MSEQQAGVGSVSGAWGRVDTTKPHPARRYDYWLGGKDNFAADRASADEIAAHFPTAPLSARENRDFLRRAVTYLAGEAGIRQFLDIGTGIPTANNTHQVAQAVAPTSRVVYVDNDPIVLAHARALLQGTDEGATTYIDADLRNPDAILTDPALTQVLDMSQPVALMLIAIMHFVTDDSDPYGAVGRLVRALPPGSYVAMSHFTHDFLSPEDAALATVVTQRGPTMRPRSRMEISRFFESLDLVPPGIVNIGDWRAQDLPQPRPSATDLSTYAAVGRKP